MPIYFGSDEPVDIRIGADAVKAVYVGSEKVWPTTPPPSKSQALYVLDWAGLYGIGVNDVLTMPTDGSAGPAGLGMSLGYPPNIGVDSSGAVYVPDFGAALGGTNALYKFANGTQSSIPIGGISIPGAPVAAGDDGTIYLADLSVQKIYAYESGAWTDLVITGIASPVGLAVGPDGSLYVADAGNGSVIRYSGGVQSTLPLTGLTDPQDVDVDAAGVVYVADGSGKKVVRYDGTETVLGIAFSSVSAASVAADNDGNVFATDGGALIRWDGTTQTTLIPSQSSGHVCQKVAIGPEQ